MTKPAYLAPEGAITPTGPWSLASRAGDFVFVAGMRGIDPASGALVAGDEARIRQGFDNMAHIVASEGGSLRDAVTAPATVPVVPLMVGSRLWKFK